MPNKVNTEALMKMIKATELYVEQLEKHINTLETSTVLFIAAMENDDLSKRYSPKLEASARDLKTAKQHAEVLLESLSKHYKNLTQI